MSSWTWHEQQWSREAGFGWRCSRTLRGKAKCRTSRASCSRCSLASTFSLSKKLAGTAPSSFLRRWLPTLKISALIPDHLKTTGSSARVLREMSRRMVLTAQRKRASQAQAFIDKHNAAPQVSHDHFHDVALAACWKAHHREHIFAVGWRRECRQPRWRCRGLHIDCLVPLLLSPSRVEHARCYREGRLRGRRVRRGRWWVRRRRRQSFVVVIIGMLLVGT